MKLCAISEDARGGIEDLESCDSLGQKIQSNTRRKSSTKNCRRLHEPVTISSKFFNVGGISPVVSGAIHPREDDTRESQGDIPSSRLRPTDCHGTGAKRGRTCVTRGTVGSGDRWDSLRRCNSVRSLARARTFRRAKMATAELP